jgi:hypothetical protein
MGVNTVESSQRAAVVNGFATAASHHVEPDGR